MTTTSRKIRAIAAGTAVIGIGAAVTLAAWSDSEFAQGTFATGNFGIEASANGADFANHTASDSALSLTFVGADQLAPGQTVATNYQIRNIANGADSTVTFASQDATGDLANALTAQIIKTADATCAADTQGEALDLNGTFDLTGQTPQNLCVKVTLSADYSNVTTQEGTFVWGFTAEEQ